MYSPITVLLICCCILLLLVTICLQRNYLSWFYSQIGMTIPNAEVCWGCVYWVQNWKKGLFTSYIIITRNFRQQTASLSTKNDDFVHLKYSYPMMWSEEAEEMWEESEVTRVGSSSSRLQNWWEWHLQAKFI